MRGESSTSDGESSILAFSRTIIHDELLREESRRSLNTFREGVRNRLFFSLSVINRVSSVGPQAEKGDYRPLPGKVL